MLWACAVTASAQTLLIDYDDGDAGNGMHDAAVREGDFTELTDGDWSPWVNLGTDPLENVPTDLPSEVGSDENLALEGGGERVAARDTGHAVAANDTFDLGFMWRRASGTSPGEQATLSLYTTVDNTITGEQQAVVASLVSTQPGGEAWLTASATNVPVSGYSGGRRPLFVKIEAADGVAEYSRLDNVYVRVTKGPPQGAVLVVK
jgi:hypothetical protein